MYFALPAILDAHVAHIRRAWLAKCGGNKRWLFILSYHLRHTPLAKYEEVRGAVTYVRNGRGERAFCRKIGLMGFLPFRIASLFLGGASYDLPNLENGS